VPLIPEQVVPKVILMQVDFGASCAIIVRFYSESLCKKAQVDISEHADPPKSGSRSLYLDG
jgi:hypothetical protein